jgi:hypothetical protein
MSPKIFFYLLHLLPLAVFGQTAVQNYTRPGFAWVEQGKLYNDGYLQPLDWKVIFGQPVYKEPLSLTGMIRRNDNKMGASGTGGVVYTGADDVFAYAHYGRTGKLIWRTSPIANNMMATRWSLANISLFRHASLSQFQTN